MALKFRNLTVSPEDPVEMWGFEGLLAAVERGSLPNWRRIAEALNAQPWGPVSLDLEEVIEAVEDPGMALLFADLIARARRRQEDRERAAVVAELREDLKRSGLSQKDFALRLGTSASRLSTYLSGKVVPSATLMVRARDVGR